MMNPLTPSSARNSKIMSFSWIIVDSFELLVEIEDKINNILTKRTKNRQFYEYYK